MAANQKSPDEILHQAIKITEPTEQKIYLDIACKGNESLRAEVESLFKAYAKSGDFLESPAIDPDMTVLVTPLTEKPGTVVGRYKLLEKIGEGGMAVVYMAEQNEPIRRKVALKIIKLGMDTKEVIARFEAERQALAMMDHPNIAKVLDAGATETGRPYFVMELVRGIAITEYCDKNKLSTADRLQLFIQVCRAVQHAHQKGVIHRDIKPSNVMVTLHEGRPQAVVIDFGIAKATNQRLTEQTLFTRYAQLIGTPEYMSPEQAEMSRLDVDTRTDIYSLGVLLYELLTGSTPFDGEQLRQGGYAGIQRIIRETEPQKPSTKLSTLGKTLTEVARSRHTTAEILPRLVRGDLDWIVMKALEKDRTRRYETAHALVEDIERHLRDEPISAGRPSALHRCKKFVRRNRALVMGAGAVGVVLIVGIIGISTFALRAARARDEATAVLAFIDEDLMGSVALQQAMSQQVTVRSILDAAAERLEGRFANRPLAEASIRQTLGKTYIELGHYEQAEPHLKRAYDLRSRLLGDQDLLTLNSMSQLGQLYERQTRYKDAEPLLVQALESRRRILGTDHADTLQTSVWLGTLYAEMCTPESIEQADKLLEDTLKSGRAVLGEESPIVLEATYSLAFLQGAIQLRLEEAGRLCLKGWKTAGKALGEGHRLTYRFMGLAAWLEASAGQFEEAQRHAQAVLEVNSRVLGEEHPDTLDAMCTLGMAHSYQGNLKQAEHLLTLAIKRMRSLLGEGHALVMIYSRELARVYLCQGRSKEAEDLLRRMIDEGGRLLGDDHLLPMHAGFYIMALYAMQERDNDLRTWCSQKIEKISHLSGQDHMAVSFFLSALTYLQATYPSSVIRNGTEAVKNAKRNCQLTSGSRGSLVLLAAAYAEAGDFDSAKQELKNALRATDSPGDWWHFSPNIIQYLLKRFESGRVIRDSVLTAFATTMIAEGKYAAAEENLNAALSVARRYLGKTHPETLGCILAFIELYEAWDKPDEAAKWRDQLSQLEAHPQSGESAAP